jgi:hypothetical protein
VVLRGKYTLGFEEGVECVGRKMRGFEEGVEDAGTFQARGELLRITQDQFGNYFVRRN